jgi:hypothetical protein
MGFRSCHSDHHGSVHVVYCKDNGMAVSYHDDRALYTGRED